VGFSWGSRGPGFNVSRLRRVLTTVIGATIETLHLETLILPPSTALSNQ
jgi:hypothetical protein